MLSVLKAVTSVSIYAPSICVAADVQRFRTLEITSASDTAKPIVAQGKNPVNVKKDLVIFAFSKPPAFNQWMPINDTVMGGYLKV